MALIFGFDIGTTSIGFAVIEHDPDRATGRIRRMGVRIFPEARDPKGTPLNQERRAARMRRRQLRRRRERRRLLHDLLHEAGLLPARGSPEWDETMKFDPYDLRKRASEGGNLSPFEVGRAVYHLAQRRHFKGRDIDEISEQGDLVEDKEEGTDEKKAKTGREETLQELKEAGGTLGAWLANRGPHERKRGVHATRKIVEKEFERVWKDRLPGNISEAVREAVFRQRPVFWRLNTLGECRFVPGAPLCPKGSWLSQQRRMLEKLNNLEHATGNRRPLDEEERKAILDKLQTQASMTWGGVRSALKPLYKARGEPGAERRLKFNLEEGGEKTLLGNAVEAKLTGIFGDDWQNHPHKQGIRDAAHDYIRQADYGEIGKQRVVILSAEDRRKGRERAAQRFAGDFGISKERAEALAAIKLPIGWEPYSVEALRAMLPRLEEGVRFGALVTGPDWETWRNETFPARDRPTGEIMDRLPSPTRKNREEMERIARLRNPTVARAQNELRKVVNNLIDMFGKPDLIRVELTRDVGLSKREREEKSFGIRRQERRREAARKDLEEKGIAEPSRREIEKWMLWEECGRRCPYTGDHICFDDLFRTSEFEVEHIWPRSRSLDHSYRNKTLCRKDVNIKKGNRTPFEYFDRDAHDEWETVLNRLDGMKASKGGAGMSPGKIRRFKAESIPEDFAARQLNDTGYAARETVAFLKRLWPDIGRDAPVTVQAVTGRVTGHLRRLWGLNNILSEDGEKTRADHRHHAVDALVVACCHPGMTQRLSRYWQQEDNPEIPDPPSLPKPWEAIRADADRAVAEVVVSHRVRKKVSGPLHKETVYGDTHEEETGKDGTIYRYFVTRKQLEDLSKSDFADRNADAWPDEKIRDIVKNWVDRHGGDPKKAFAEGYPKRGRKGPEIRKVRLRRKQQVKLMARVSTGFADLGNNHHIAIYRMADGSVDYDVVSLMEASQRLANGEPVMRRKRGDGSQFVMSLSAGDSLEFTKNGETKVRIVEGAWDNGQVVLVDHDDATGESRFRPGAKAIASSGAKKFSVDPIGRIRPAND